MLALLASLVLVFDAQERFPFTTVEGSGPPVAYTRQAPGGWTQHWLYATQNPQDRGILRTGRHAGDWEMVQTHPRKGVVVTQHSGAERCGWDEVQRGPVVYVAHGSHALYLRPGLRDRTFPDPNDEADGRGSRVRPRVRPSRGSGGTIRTRSRARPRPAAPRAATPRASATGARRASPAPPAR